MRLTESKSTATILIFALVIGAAPCLAEDWPQWGRNPSRNMCSNDTGVATTFDPGEFIRGSEDIDLSTTTHVKWVTKLGSQAYGNPTVANGRVYVGTNNDIPRDPKFKGDRSNVYCLDEQSGKLLWQFSVPKLGAGKVSDWEFLGICSSSAVDGDRVFVVTNLCEVVCLDAKGMADGNDGPYKDEASYLAGNGKPPIEPGHIDGDIIWRYDMRDELGIFPHNVTSSSPLVVGDCVYVTTSNGVDWSHVNIPSPKSPTLIALDKQSGELVAEEAVGISKRLLHCNWSSPAFGLVDAEPVLLFGAGDGFCYGFDTEPKEDEEGFPVFVERWRYDCNPPEYRSRDGKPIKYATRKGPSEIIATPVYYQGRVYVAIGQDPEHGEGVGALHCIDPGKTGDISQSGSVWTYTDINRTISTVSIAEGLVYAADYSGVIHCLDAVTGQRYWTHDTLAHIWGSTLLVDSKVYIGNEDGILTVLAAGKEKKVMAEVELPAPIYSTPVVANGVLYIATQTHLYAIAQ